MRVADEVEWYGVIAYDVGAAEEVVHSVRRLANLAAEGIRIRRVHEPSHVASIGGNVNGVSTVVVRDVGREIHLHRLQLVTASFAYTHWVSVAKLGGHEHPARSAAITEDIAAVAAVMSPIHPVELAVASEAVRSRNVGHPTGRNKLIRICARTTTVEHVIFFIYSGIMRGRIRSRTITGVETECRKTLHAPGRGAHRTH